MANKMKIVDAIPRDIYTLLNELGIPSHIKGYDYLAYGVKIISEDPTNIKAMTKVVYPEIAQAFDTIPSRVERAIRHAIETSFNHGISEGVYKFFGNSIPQDSGKPTNSQFMSTVSRYYRANYLVK